MAVFWDVAHFRGTYCLPPHDLKMETVGTSGMSVSIYRQLGTTSQNIAIFIHVAIRT
jgi:hypothetical protein